MKIKNLFLAGLFMLSACTLWGQAKKPIIMVIPSDAYCNRAGYVTTYQDANGKTVTVADNEKAFIQDEEFASCNI